MNRVPQTEKIARLIADIARQGPVPLEDITRPLERLNPSRYVADALDLCLRAGVIRVRNGNLKMGIPAVVFAAYRTEFINLCFDCLFSDVEDPEYWTNLCSEMYPDTLERTFSRTRLTWAWETDEQGGLEAWVALSGKDKFEVAPYNQYQKKWVVIKNRVMMFGFEDSKESAQALAQSEVGENRYGSRNEKIFKYRKIFFAFFARSVYNRRVRNANRERNVRAPRSQKP